MKAKINKVIAITATPFKNFVGTKVEELFNGRKDGFMVSIRLEVEKIESDERIYDVEFGGKKYLYLDIDGKYVLSNMGVMDDKGFSYFNMEEVELTRINGKIIGQNS